MERLAFRNLFSPAALACFFLTAVIGFGLDQWSKVAAVSKLAINIPQDPGGQPTPIGDRTQPFIPGLIEFVFTANRGAVFGMGQGQRALFVGVSFAAIVFIFYLFLGSGRQRIYQIILGMLMAGVLGNLYDRVNYGYVRDMIHALPKWPHAFPWIFNVADSLLCTGVFLMIVYSLFQHPEDSPQTQPA
jgi:lipoprotein signal peptidase